MKNLTTVSDLIEILERLNQEHYLLVNNTISPIVIGDVSLVNTNPEMEDGKIEYYNLSSCNHGLIPKKEYQNILNL